MVNNHLTLTSVVVVGLNPAHVTKWEILLVCPEMYTAVKEDIKT